MADQRLLITNSSGGVGSLAVQLAKARGAHVTAVASARNEAFRLHRQPFEEVAHDIDVVFDTVGGDTFQRAFRTLRKGGRMVTVVAFPGGEAERYGVSVTRSFTVPSVQDLTAITDLVEADKVAPTVDKLLPLVDVKQALSLSKGGRTRGKIILQVGD